MDPAEFAYEDGAWLEHEAPSDWPYWRVTRRLADVDDGSRFYQLSWQHPRTGQYREEYVPADDARADFGTVEEDTVWAAAGQDPPEGSGGHDAPTGDPGGSEGSGTGSNRDRPD